MSNETKPITFAEAEEILEETFKGERQRIDFVTKWQTKKDSKTGEKWKDNPRMPTQTAYMATGELYDTTKYKIIRGLKLAHDSQIEAANKILDQFLDLYSAHYEINTELMEKLRAVLSTNANRSIKEKE